MKKYSSIVKESKIPNFQQNPSLDTVILCDLDGTISLLNGRSPYDASNCDNDALNVPVADVLKHYKVIFVSGRDEKYREPTLRFFKKHNISNYIALYMRKENDMRKDSIIKEEIYNEYIKDKYNVLFVLEDRNQVVELWRKLGLTCFQVAEGNF